MSARRIEQVIEAHRALLLALPGVIGIAEGVSQGAPCIRVFVVGADAGQRPDIPRQIDEFPVQVDVTGPFRARSG